MCVCVCVCVCCVCVCVCVCVRERERERERRAAAKDNAKRCDMLSCQGSWCTHTHTHTHKRRAAPWRRASEILLTPARGVWCCSGCMRLLHLRPTLQSFRASPSACVSIRQHTSASVNIRQHTCACSGYMRLYCCLCVQLSNPSAPRLFFFEVNFSFLFRVRWTVASAPNSSAIIPAPRLSFFLIFFYMCGDCSLCARLLCYATAPHLWLWQQQRTPARRLPSAAHNGALERISRAHTMCALALEHRLLIQPLHQYLYFCTSKARKFECRSTCSTLSSATDDASPGMSPAFASLAVRSAVAWAECSVHIEQVQSKR